MLIRIVRVVIMILWVDQCLTYRIHCVFKVIAAPAGNLRARFPLACASPFHRPHRPHPFIALTPILSFFIHALACQVPSRPQFQQFSLLNLPEFLALMPPPVPPPNPHATLSVVPKGPRRASVRHACQCSLIPLVLSYHTCIPCTPCLWLP